MAKTEEFRVRVAREEKEKAKEVFAQCGLTPSAAFTLFIRQSILAGGLPFQVAGGQTSENRNS